MPRPINGRGAVFFGIIILVGAGGALSGCSSNSGASGAAAATDTGSTTQNPVTPDGTGTVTGQVIDGATRTPIGNAEVSLVVNGAKQTTNSSTSSDPDLTGTFVFSGVPSGVHSLKITATGYAPWRHAVVVSQSQDGAPHTENLGAIGLGKAFTLTVVATTDGEPVNGVTILAEPNWITSDCGSPQYWYLDPPLAFFAVDDQEASAVTDGNGQAQFTGLNQCLTYVLVALPHDTDGDGTYDHSAATAYFDGRTNSATTVAMALKSVQRNDPITLVGTSLDNRSRALFTARNITDTGLDPGSDLTIHGAGCISTSNYSCPSPPVNAQGYPILGVPSANTHTAFKLVFNYPVSATETTVTYQDDLINPDVDGNDTSDPGFPATRVVVAASATLDATGTILTVTPPATGFPQNETITVGPVTAIVNGVATSFEQEVYVENTTAAGLSPSTIVTADNYGLSNTSSIYQDPSVYLEFPEFVTGSYRVIAYTTSSGIVTVDLPPVQVNPMAYYYGGSNQIRGEMVYTDGSVAPACIRCGSGSGVAFRVPVFLVPPSSYCCSYSTPLLDGNSLRVEIDVQDAVGNRLTKDIELVVQ